MSTEDERRLAALDADISRLLAERHPMATVEHKAAAVVVHTRGLPRDIADAAVAEAREVALTHSGVRSSRASRSSSCRFHPPTRAPPSRRSGETAA